MITPKDTRKLERKIKEKWATEKVEAAKVKAKKWAKKEKSVRKALKRKIKAPHIPLNRFLVGNRMRVKLGG